MKMTIRDPGARYLAVVNPETGVSIPLVQALDTGAGTLETLTVAVAAFGAEMQTRRPDGGWECHPYTVLSARAGSGEKLSITRIWTCGYDVVDTHTGTVLEEVQGPPVPLKAADPDAWAREERRTEAVPRVGPDLRDSGP